MLRMIILGLAMLLTTAAFGASGAIVLQATNYDEFSQKFCSASRDTQHVFVVPIDVFMEQTRVKCDDGESQLRMREPKDDPGHMIFNIDPPHGSRASLDCDGKADIDMTVVAINCLPVSQETKKHPKM